MATQTELGVGATVGEVLDQGRAAFLAGLEYSDNPCPDGSPRACIWQRGWLAAEAEAVKAPKGKLTPDQIYEGMAIFDTVVADLSLTWPLDRRDINRLENALFPHVPAGGDPQTYATLWGKMSNERGRKATQLTPEGRAKIEATTEADIRRYAIEDGEHDPVDHPRHYTSHPSGVECITVTEHMGFNLGNAVKYIWRADLKSDDPIQDLEKAAWYINREIEKRKRTT